MSALRVSRSAAEESVLIAASQRFASMAAFPAAKSGSSCAPAGVSSAGSAATAPGSSASARPSSATDARRPLTALLARHAPLHPAQLRAVAVLVAREARELVRVLSRLFRVAGRLRAAGRGIRDVKQLQKSFDPTGMTLLSWRRW